MTPATQSRPWLWSHWQKCPPLTAPPPPLTPRADPHTSFQTYGEASIPPSRRQRTPSQTSAHALSGTSAHPSRHQRTPHSASHRSQNPQDTQHKNKQPRTSSTTIVRRLAQSPHVRGTEPNRKPNPVCETNLALYTTSNSIQYFSNCEMESTTKTLQVVF